MGRWKFFGGKAVGAVSILDYANLVDGEVIVLGDKTYEWDNDNDVVAGNIKVTIGANNAACITNLIAAINANKPSKPCTAVVDPKTNTVARIFADNRGEAGEIAFTTDMSDSENTIAAVNNKLAYGENGGNELLHKGRYVVTAIDVLADNMMIETGLPSAPEDFLVQVRSAAGVLKAVTVEWTASGTKIRGNFAGATDPVAGDVVSWIAYQ
jgi:hypothetical protein